MRNTVDPISVIEGYRDSEVNNYRSRIHEASVYLENDVVDVAYHHLSKATKHNQVISVLTAILTDLKALEAS